MASKPRRGILTGLLLGSAILGAAPASAFEIFGIHLWGARSAEEEDRDVIDPQRYTVDFRLAGGEGSLEGDLKNASSLWGDRERAASGNAGLLSKARGDYRRILAALYTDGYYGAEISIRIAGQEAADMSLAVDLPADVPIVIDVQAGPQFDFGTAAIVNAPPARVEQRDQVDTPASVGFATGKPARAGVVTQASALSIERWRQVGHAKAREADREVIADHTTDKLDVTLTLDPDRVAHYGPTRVVGSKRLDPAFVAFMADLPEGQVFDPDDIKRGQNRLTRLNVFRSLRFEQAPAIAPDGSLPMTIRVEERRPRTIGFGGTYSTIDGLGVAAYWQHNNLLGRAERLRFDASVDGIGQSLNPDDYDYNLGVTFTKPGIWTPDTDFIASLIAKRVDFDTYRETSITASAGVAQQFGEFFTGSLAGEISHARYEDDFGTRDFNIVALVGNAAYDRRDDPLDATRGYFLAASAEPLYETNYGNAALQATLDGRVYHGFGAERRVVLAARAKVGSFLGPDAAESPPDLLFFAGGGGSVRGYAYRSIGVDSIEIPGEDPFVVGGAGLLEGSVELRYHFTEKWGAVGFVDTGYVTANAGFSGESDLRTGTGLGVRYYTSIGVLRADLATPVNRRPEDSVVALYIGIGQAF